MSSDYVIIPEDALEKLIEFAQNAQKNYIVKGSDDVLKELMCYWRHFNKELGLKTAREKYAGKRAILITYVYRHFTSKDEAFARLQLSDFEHLSADEFDRIYWIYLLEVYAPFLNSNNGELPSEHPLNEFPLLMNGAYAQRESIKRRLENEVALLGGPDGKHALAIHYAKQCRLLRG